MSTSTGIIAAAGASHVARALTGWVQDRERGV